MKRAIVGLFLALLPILAGAADVQLASHFYPREKIVPLADMNPIPMRLTNCNVIGSPEEPHQTATCDLPLQAFSEPIVLREVQIHTSPPLGEQTGQLFWAAQCWVRVHVAEDGVNFHEIAKFTWPPGDFHGFNHVLAAPVGLQPSQQAVLRAIVGITSMEPDECRVEVKLYSSYRN